MTRFDDLLTVTEKLGNDLIVAQTRYALEADGHFLTPAFVFSAFIGAASVIDLAEKGHNAGTLTASEMVATQAVASLAMSVYATLYDQLSGKTPL
jgi:hypothetical protein